MTDREMVQMALEEGFSAAAVIDTKEIAFDPSFRPYCEENLCGCYGKNYSCPPDCGTPEEMERRVRAYPKALVFQTKWDIPDYQDAKSIKEAKAFHNAAMLKVIDRMRGAGLDGLMAGASCCTLCEKCAIVEGKPCKLPDRRWSCLSAYCVFVRKLAESSGMEYACEDGSLAFFGMYAFSEK